ncbi:MAG: HAMP domain-containing histidine kinase [Deltaproteobacteria bacterium]|nr:HAMP domain-containing histidine kinase [Deltaproteobacteria bacterium]
MASSPKNVESLVSSANGGDRIRAVELLTEAVRRNELDLSSPVFGWLQRLSSDSKYEVRQAFAERSVFLPDAWLWKLLPPLLDDPNPFVRKAAQRTYRQRDNAAASESRGVAKQRGIDQLVVRLESAAGSDPQVFHRAAVSALQEAQNIKVVEFAHELKNLLHPLSSAVGRLKDEMSKQTLRKHVDTLNKISARCRRLDEFGEAMKFLAAGKNINFDVIKCSKLMELTAQSVNDLAVEKGVRLIVREAPDCNVKVVTERLTRALANIVRNAIEASSPSQQVEFSAREVEDGVELIVKDNGVGIKQDAKKVIFDLLVSGKREKEQGEHQGIGLFLAYNVIVAEHLGGIEVDSDGASWTVFTIRIPAR